MLKCRKMVNSLTFVLEPEIAGQPIREIRLTGQHDDPQGYGIEHAVSVLATWDDDEAAGYFIFNQDKSDWRYIGDQLSLFDQEQIADFLKNYKDGDSEL